MSLEKGNLEELTKSVDEMKNEMKSMKMFIKKASANLEMTERMLSVMFNWWFTKIGEKDKKLLYAFFEKGFKLPDLFAEEKSQIEEKFGV